MTVADDTEAMINAIVEEYKLTPKQAEVIMKVHDGYLDLLTKMLEDDLAECSGPLGAAPSYRDVRRAVSSATGSSFSQLLLMLFVSETKIEDRLVAIEKRLTELEGA